MIFDFDKLVDKIDILDSLVFKDREELQIPYIDKLSIEK